MKKLLVINICMVLLLAANGAYAMAPASLPNLKKKLAQHEQESVELKEQLYLLNLTKELTPLLTKSLETAAERAGHKGMGTAELTQIIGEYALGNDYFPSVKRTKGRVDTDALDKQRQDAFKKTKQNLHKKNQEKEEIVNDYIQERDVRLLQGACAIIATLIYHAPELTWKFITKITNLLNETCDTETLCVLNERVCDTFTEGLKVSMAHGLYATYHICEHNKPAYPFIAKNLKLFCYYMVIDLTCKYSSDLLEKLIATQKYHDHLSQKIPHYITTKAKVAWATKALIATKADRWMLKLVARI